MVTNSLKCPSHVCSCMSPIHCSASLKSPSCSKPPQRPKRSKEKLPTKKSTWPNELIELINKDHLSQHTWTWGNGILGSNAAKVSEGAPASGAGACCWSASGAAASDQCNCGLPLKSVGVVTGKMVTNSLKCPCHVCSCMCPIHCSASL